ncbi:unnamed protein product [Periconia digitata]|uniref:Uncharacterized protein n=1 Tax=Periconia digitata TaxID=1303443 RepID=A0A9W4U4V9_9PLEO|nr:unnamed protein product [Periconia digitata]
MWSMSMTSDDDDDLYRPPTPEPKYRGKGKGKAKEDETPKYQDKGQGRAKEDENTKNPVYNTPRHFYPTSREGAPTDRSLPLGTIQGNNQLREQIHGLVERINAYAGNIVPLIFEDLASPEGEEDRKLLPAADWIKPIYNYDLSQDLIQMLNDKITRYSRQHAHDLAEMNCVDLMVFWEAQPYTTQGDVRWVTPQQEELFKKLYDCHYKTLSWDVMNAGDGRQAPARRSGFFAVIPADFFFRIRRELDAGWKIQIERIVQPKHMNLDELHEMQAYHELRKVAYMAKQEEEKAKREREEGVERDREHAKRRENTYAKATEINWEQFRRLNLNN